jgi:subtilisin family serine protease
MPRLLFVILTALMLAGGYTSGWEVCAAAGSDGLAPSYLASSGDYVPGLGWPHAPPAYWDVMLHDNVDAEALGVAREQGHAPTIVILAEQADVSGAYALPTKRQKTRYVYDTLRALAERTQPGLVTWLQSRGAEVQRFSVMNALAVDADAETLLELATRPEVERVLLERTVEIIEPVGEFSLPYWPQGPQAPEQSLKVIGADRAWDAGYMGQNIVVAIADTGAVWEHAALKSRYRGWDDSTGEATHDYNWHDGVKNAQSPVDVGGHGTHVTGTVVGGPPGQQVGVAPGAEWIACRLIESSSGSDASILDCLDWLLAPGTVSGARPDPDMAPHVVNNSWGCTPGGGGCNWNWLQATVRNYHAAGIMFVVAAGNSGSKCNTIGVPALYEESFAIGNYSQLSRSMNPSSSRGPVNADRSGRVKPDVAAPGTNINSSTNDRSYGQKTGTSMASPHAAGAVAVLWSARPALVGQIDETKRIFHNTAAPRTDDNCQLSGQVPNNSWGHGLMDLFAAIGGQGGSPGDPPPPPSERCNLPGDVNCDRCVWYEDYDPVLERWDTSAVDPDPDGRPETPNYSPMYDLDGSGRIDIVDVVMVLVHFGTGNCPDAP